MEPGENPEREESEWDKLIEFDHEVYTKREVIFVISEYDIVPYTCYKLVHLSDG